MVIRLEDNYTGGGGYILSPNGVTTLQDRKGRKLRKKMKQEAKTKRVATKLARKQERQEARTEGMRSRRAVQQSRTTKRRLKNEAQYEFPTDPGTYTSADTDYSEPIYQDPIYTDYEELPEDEYSEASPSENENDTEEETLEQGIWGSIAKGAVNVGRSLLAPTVAQKVPTITKAQYDLAVKRAQEAEQKAQEAEKQKVMFGLLGLGAGAVTAYLMKK
jgi:FtsZ-interacting cell division protein ZipA